MNPTIVIENVGRRTDRIYLGFTLMFGVIWTSGTVFLTVLVLSKFSWFLACWLPIGYGVVFGILSMLLLSRRPQTLEAAADALIIHGTGIWFAGTVSIPRELKIKIGFGHYGGQNNGEIVNTLNIFSDLPWWKCRILISPFSHPTEKRKIFLDLQTFLSDNGFHVEFEDTYSKYRSEPVGARQPATRPESKSNGSDKPQPEEEGRSR